MFALEFNKGELAPGQMPEEELFDLVVKLDLVLHAGALNWLEGAESRS
jgi:hypothetical protein